MITVSLSNLTLILGAHVIFRDLSWEIQHDQKIGLIGANGSGKSSLLRTIVGEYTPEQGGSLVRAKNVSIGYLPQHPELNPEQTAYAAAKDGSPRVAQVLEDLEIVEASLGDPNIYGRPAALQRALARQQALLDEWASLGGDTYPGRVRELLLGLGLPEADLEKPLGVLSGGQKKLVSLARLLLARPSVLLLDEPDNHLDVTGKMYLENLIREYPGAVVIVSHDRYLLDATVTHIAEIEDGRLSTFTGDYTAFILDKDLRLARQEQIFAVQQREQKRIEAAVKRYAQWVQFNEKFASRLRAMRTRLDRFEAERVDRPTLERRQMDLRLNGWRGSNKVLELRRVEKAYGERRLFQSVDEVIWHGERVGMIGPNGAGKSVLLRMILGEEAPDAGEIIIGPSIRVGYYAQEHETLDFDQTLLDTVRRAGSLSESAAVAFLLRYLFSYRQATQRIRDLSGGERSRLQLALLVLSGANFLLLDEPTNNLDIASAEVLENALADFNGTVLVISHDRYFLDRVVDRLLVIESGRLMAFAGGYSDWAAEPQAGKMSLAARFG